MTERNEPYLDDPFYMECVPIRIIPTPSTSNGPTAQWMKAHPTKKRRKPADTSHLRAVGE